MTTPGTVRGKDARSAVLFGLIDDAGLFPPARLPMDTAVQSHRRIKASPYRWAVARFGCPVGRLDELAEHLPLLADLEEVRLSVVLDTAPRRWRAEVPDRVDGLARFIAAAPANVTVEIVEAQLVTGDASQVAEQLGFLVDLLMNHMNRPPTETYFEVPLHDEDWHDRLDASLRGCTWAHQAGPTGLRVGAKIRCGGLSAEAFPTSEQLATFIHDCTRMGIPFKATAGLHQALRHTDPATGFEHHGFLNAVTAAVLARSERASVDTLQQVLETRNADQFGLTRDALCWNGHEISADLVEKTRQEGFIAYGSCATAEPLDELRALGMLPPPETVASGVT